MQNLVTVIVPVYLVENYLPRCVDSLLNQTYKDIEIILVDDGSPDKCGEMCDEYAKKDDRVRVIHKENGGLSDARNVAIPLAQGHYITFVDSDDWVSEFYVEHLFDAIQKNDSDLAINWFEDIVADKDCKTVPQKELERYVCLGSQKCLKKLLYQDGIEVSAWGKLYKKDLFSNLRYPVGELYEDIPVTYECIKRAKKIAVIGNVDYFYFHRKGSIQYESFNPRKLDGVRHCLEMMKAVKQDFPDLGRAAECRYFSTVCNILFQIKDNAYTKEREFLWKEVKIYRKDILMDGKARKKAKMAALVSYLGYPIMKLMYGATQSRGKTQK